MMVITCTMAGYRESCVSAAIAAVQNTATVFRSRNAVLVQHLQKNLFAIMLECMLVSLKLPLSVMSSDFKNIAVGY